jgi:hypothetical protein
MSPTILRILIAGALLVHGVGHTLGFFVPPGSWLMPNASGSMLKVLAYVIWGLAAVGFLLALLGFLGILVPAAWWRPLAVAFAFISLLGLFLFWGSWGALNKYGALAMNVAILVTQLWLRWPPVDMFGR